MNRRFAVRTTIAALIFGAVMYFTVYRAQGATQASNFKEEVDRGGQLITTTTDAVYLQVPAGARHAEIVVYGANPVCWGANPTVAPSPGACSSTTSAACAGRWPTGMVRKIDNDRLMLSSIRVVSCAEGAATVNVHYTGDRRVGDS